MASNENSSSFRLTRGSGNRVISKKDSRDELDKDGSEQKKKGTLPYNIIWSSIALLIIITLIGTVYYFVSQ